MEYRSPRILSRFPALLLAPFLLCAVVAGNSRGVLSGAAGTGGTGPAEEETAPELPRKEEEVLTDVWEVTLDGERAGAVEDKSALDALLNELWGPCLTADTIEAGFEPAVRITKERAAPGTAEGIETVRAALTANRVGEVIYSVEPGDTLTRIAQMHETTIAEIQRLNGDRDLDLILVGDELVVKAPIPLLSVRTVDRRSYIDRIPVDTRRELTGELFKGEEDLDDPGREGWAHYIAEMTFLDGEELEDERKVLSMDPILPPEDAVILVGTKEPPPAGAVGEFIWPTKGNITSSFGKRYIFGSTSFHSGLDIGAPDGTRIRAADGGQVIFAGEGTGTNATLGNYVCIDHGNGFRTIYGHCSVLEVKEGDMVYPGQTIARVGSTGRSTGNHLHFMVKQDGINIDPLTVLPSQRS